MSNIIAPNVQWKINTSILSEEAYELHVPIFIRHIVQLPIFKNQAPPDNSFADPFLDGVRGTSVEHPHIKNAVIAPLSALDFKVALHASRPNIPGNTY